MKSSRPRKRTGSSATIPRSDSSWLACESGPTGALRMTRKEEPAAARTRTTPSASAGPPRAASVPRRAISDHHRGEDRERLRGDVGAAEQRREDVDAGHRDEQGRQRPVALATVAEQAEDERGEPDQGAEVEERRRRPGRRRGGVELAGRPDPERLERRERLGEVAEVGAEAVRVERREAAEARRSGSTRRRSRSRRRRSARAGRGRACAASPRAAPAAARRGTSGRPRRRRRPRRPRAGPGGCS